MSLHNHVLWGHFLETWNALNKKSHERLFMVLHQGACIWQLWFPPCDNILIDLVSVEFDLIVSTVSQKEQ